MHTYSTEQSEPSLASAMRSSVLSQLRHRSTVLSTHTHPHVSLTSLLTLLHTPFLTLLPALSSKGTLPVPSAQDWIFSGTSLFVPGTPWGWWWRFRLQERKRKYQGHKSHRFRSEVLSSTHWSAQQHVAHFMCSKNWCRGHSSVHTSSGATWGAVCSKGVARV